LEVVKVRGRVEEGAKWQCVLLHLYLISNVVINRGGGAIGGIMMLIWGAALGRNFDIKIGRAFEAEARRNNF
jgi:hypothetical protein